MILYRIKTNFNSDWSLRFTPQVRHKWWPFWRPLTYSRSTRASAQRVIDRHKEGDW